MMPTVLVADDERHQVTRLQKFLSENGYIVLPAYSGEEVLQIAVQNKPDILILDYCMADMNAPEVIKHLRASPQSRDLPVILVTCRVPDADLAASMEAYTEEYVVAKIQKVINPYQLLEEIKRAMTLQTPLYVFDDVLGRPTEYD